MTQHELSAGDGGAYAPQTPRPARIAFVCTSLGTNDTALLQVLARRLAKIGCRSEVLALSRPNGWRTSVAARADLPIDYTPCYLPEHQVAGYLASRLPAFNLIVAIGASAALPPVLDPLHLRPPLLEVDQLGPQMPQLEQRIAAALTPAPAAPKPAGLFRSYLQGGFECSTHRRVSDCQRLDLIAASQHDRHAEHDYRALAAHGILTVRDGLRWHLIEQQPGRYDWSSLAAQQAGARAAGSEVIWDLLHYGWPDHLDIWSPEFVTSFAAFAGAAARQFGPAGAGERRFYAPVNEISFFSWGGGDAGYLNPFANGRGFELKVQLTRAAIAAMEAILVADPAARFVHADPVINIVTDPARPSDASHAQGHRAAQFQAWDMLGGYSWPQIGGRAGLLDVIGVNFYHNNQWIHGGAPLAHDDPLARPLHELLAEVYARYGRPIFIAETGIEGDARADWLRMVLREADLAAALGVPIEGVCLYPVLDHPGWDDERYCPNGLLSWADDPAGRTAHDGLAAVIAEFGAARRAAGELASAVAGQDQSCRQSPN